MSNELDLLDRLAETDVPDPPESLDRDIHESVNRALLVSHLCDFFLRAAAWSLLEMGRAVLGLVWYTISGKYPERRRDEPREGEM